MRRSCNLSLLFPIDVWHQDPIPICQQRTTGFGPTSIRSHSFATARHRKAIRKTSGQDDPFVVSPPLPCLLHCSATDPRVCGSSNWGDCDISNVIIMANKLPCPQCIINWNVTNGPHSEQKHSIQCSKSRIVLICFQFDRFLDSNAFFYEKAEDLI